MSRKGFTLLELIVVIIIIGILATLGFTQYTKMVEKGRTAEARMILGQIRTAQAAYSQEYGTNASDLSQLAVGAPNGSCDSQHYFYYSITNTTATANRCTTGGKPPQASGSYNITLTYDTAAWGGSPGYY